MRSGSMFIRIRIWINIFFIDDQKKPNLKVGKVILIRYNKTVYVKLKEKPLGLQKEQQIL